MSWVEENLSLLRTAYPDLEHLIADGVTWVRVPAYPVPDIFTVTSAEVAFRIPSQPGEAPYGFWVHPGLTLVSGSTINNYTYPATTPWGNDWGQFSFSPVGPWQPKADVRVGPNMLSFARAIADRLREGA